MIRATALWFFGFILCAGAFGEENDFHVFTTADGQVVSAKVIRVDSGRGLVELELENKARKKIKPAVFCKADQLYIQDCEAIQEFMSSRFKVMMNKETVKSWKEMVGRQGAIKRKNQRFVYEVVFKNNCEVPFENIRVEYNIYFEQQLLGNGQNVLFKGNVFGEHSVGAVKVRSQSSMVSDPVVTYDQDLAGGFDEYVGGAPTNQKGDVEGLWMRVYLTTAGGSTVVRDFCEPSGIQDTHSWQTKTTIPKE